MTAPTSHSVVRATTSSPTTPATTCPRAVPATTPSTPVPDSTSSWAATGTTSPTVAPTPTRPSAARATTSPSPARAWTRSSATAETTGKRAATSRTSSSVTARPFFFDDHNVPGHDILIGQGGDDDYDIEGGDDIGVAGPGVEKVAGAAGYDWEIGLGDPQAQDTDLAQVFVANGVILPGVRDKFNEVEALSGGALNDTLRGDDIVPTDVGGGGFVGCDALDAAGVARINGLNQLVTPAMLTVNPAAAAASSPTPPPTSACSTATSGAPATSCSAVPVATSSRAAAPTTSSTATGTSTCGSACAPTRRSRPPDREHRPDDRPAQGPATSAPAPPG